MKILERIESNQDILIKNQHILSSGQVSLNENLQKLGNKIVEIEDICTYRHMQKCVCIYICNYSLFFTFFLNYTITHFQTKAELMAQSRLLMDCNVAVKRVQGLLCRLIDEKSSKD